MKTTKIIYWISTVLLAVSMVYSFYSELYSPEVKLAFEHLGFPDYFRVQLAIMKMIGIVVVLTPLPDACKQWAYSGFAITFASAFIAHTLALDPISNRVAPLITLLILLISYVTYTRRRNAASINSK